MIMPPGKPYDGFQKKLIIAFDVGATFSGVSYVVLIPRELPLIQGVKVGGDCKIPSVVCYDGTGNVVAIGSETKLTRILILNFRKSRVLWRLMVVCLLLINRPACWKWFIGSSYIFDHRIWLRSKGSLSKIYRPFCRTRELLTSLAAFWDIYTSAHSTITGKWYVGISPQQYGLCPRSPQRLGRETTIWNASSGYCCGIGC